MAGPFGLTRPIRIADTAFGIASIAPTSAPPAVVFNGRSVIAADHDDAAVGAPQRVKWDDFKRSIGLRAFDFAAPVSITGTLSVPAVVTLLSRIPLRETGIIAAPGSLTLTGLDAVLIRALIMDAAPGSLTLTGINAGFTVGVSFEAAPGSLTLTGIDAGFVRALIMDADRGSMILSGRDAGLYRGFSLLGAGGAFALSGIDARLLRALVIAATQGAVTLSGLAATLTYNPNVTDARLALSGDMTDGDDILLLSGDEQDGGDGLLISPRYTLTAARGAFTLSGLAAALQRGLIMQTNLGTFTFAGKLAAFSVLTGALLLSGDEQDGADKILLSGDEQDGADVLLKSKT